MLDRVCQKSYHKSNPKRENTKRRNWRESRKMKLDINDLMKECERIANERKNQPEKKNAVLPGNGKKNGAWDLFNPLRRRCGYDNSKIGAYSATISAVPGNVESFYYYANEDVLTEYKDMIDAYGVEMCVSCPCHCPGCYADKEKRYQAVFETLLLNTLEMHLNPVLFYELVENEIFNGAHSKEIEKVRIHECGEFVNEADFFAAMDMMSKHTDMPFFGYSKQPFVGVAYVNGEIPENVHFSCSPWVTRDGKVLCAAISDMHQFIFDDGSDPTRDSIIHCYCSNPDGTVNKGNTCTGCGRCVKARKGTKTAVFPHGVALKNTWLAGRALYYIDVCGADRKEACALAIKDGLTACKRWQPESVEKLIVRLVKAVKDAEKEREQ